MHKGPWKGLGDEIANGLVHVAEERSFGHFGKLKVRRKVGAKDPWAPGWHPRIVGVRSSYIGHGACCFEVQAVETDVQELRVILVVQWGFGEPSRVFAGRAINVSQSRDPNGSGTGYLPRSRVC